MARGMNGMQCSEAGGRSAVTSHGQCGNTKRNTVGGCAFLWERGGPGFRVLFPPVDGLSDGYVGDG